MLLCYLFESKTKLLKVVPIYIVFICSAVANLITQNNGNQILDKWISDDKTMMVEVFKENSKYSAKIIEAKNKQDIGKLIVWGLLYNDVEEEWSGGKVKLPDMKHSANCYVKVNNDKLIITGYHGLRLFGSSQTYSRNK